MEPQAWIAQFASICQVKGEQVWVPAAGNRPFEDFEWASASVYPRWGARSRIFLPNGSMYLGLLRTSTKEFVASTSYPKSLGSLVK